MKSFIQSFFYLLLFVALAPVCLAQTAATSLKGTIFDPSGAVIANATVTISLPEIGYTRSTQTGSEGEYTFSQIPPGKYTIKVDVPGYGQKTIFAELLVNQPSTVDTKMKATTETVVNVDSTAGVLNTADATVGTPFNTVQVQTLPFEGNNIMDLLSLQAGVLFTGDTNSNSNTDTRPGSVNGARSDQNNLTLDGVDNNVSTKGYAFEGVLRATRDSLDEFRVVTTNSNADSGRSSGAQVALVTRSGTNSIHGSAYYYYRPTDTVANDWFLKKSQASSLLQNRPPKLLRNLYGASLGGPVLHDKLFFFGAYEGLRQAEALTVTNIVPTTSLVAGNVKYLNSTGGTTTLDRANLATIDPNCSAAGSCPNGPGANPAVLSYFSQYPGANSSTKGDGLNTAAYTFASPNPLSNATTTARMDYAIRSHRLFVRGNLQQDNTSSALQFPGQPPPQRSTTTPAALRPAMSGPSLHPSSTTCVMALRGPARPLAATSTTPMFPSAVSSTWRRIPRRR